jgi:integrase
MKLRVMTDLIERHCAHLRQRGLSDNTVNDRRALLRRMDAELPMGLEEALVEELSNWLGREGWSRQTRATYFGHVVGFYAWACDPRDPHLSSNPAASLARPRVPRGVPKPVTDEELAEALAVAQRWYLAELLAAYASCRCCELAVIERGDVNRHTTTIVGKGGKTRVVPTHPLVWDAVRDLPPGRLVPGTPETISKGARDHFDRTGMPAVTMHRLRHWFATTALANGADLLTVSLLMGHSSTRTTVVYCEISDRQRVSAVLALPVLTPAST